MRNPTLRSNRVVQDLRTAPAGNVMVGDVTALRGVGQNLFRYLLHLRIGNDI
jgi:hypothetical protein